MPSISNSAKLYQERRGERATVRGPGPMLCPDDNLIHSLPLDPPFPPAGLVAESNGTPPPDQALTKPWPHGAKEPN